MANRVLKCCKADVGHGQERVDERPFEGGADFLAP
jgi:hypothetical protein